MFSAIGLSCIIQKNRKRKVVRKIMAGIDFRLPFFIVFVIIRLIQFGVINIMEEKIRILLDTDAGDDIDDALAIALGLSSKEVEFVGITTVFKNTEDRARLVKKLVSDGGFDIPVYAGYCGGIKVPTDAYNGFPNQIKGNDGKFHMCQFTEDLLLPKYAPVNAEEGFEGASAVDFIIESCYKYGKELIVLAIGPFTNIAKVIEKDPDALNHAKKVVIMGGAFFTTFPEWNVLCDVDASDLLFSGAVKNLECVGLDVTWQTKLRPEEAEIMRNYKGKAYSEYASKLVRIWMERNKGAMPTLHDPLAFFYCICPDILEMEDMCGKVATQGEARGVTLNVSKWEAFHRRGMHSAQVKAAKKVDRERFLKEYLKRVFNCK